MTNIRRRFSNTANPTTLNGAITAVQTSLVVTSDTGYPAVPFTIRCDNEVMLVTAKSGTTFTVTRGYDGTTGASHSNGADITHVAIAADFRNAWLDTIVYDDSLTAYDDEFDDSESVSWSIATPTGTATWSESRGVVTALYNSQATSDFAARITSLNGLSYPLYTTTAIRMSGQRINYQMAGLCFSNGDTTASNCVLAHYQTGTDPGNTRFERRNGTFANITTAQTAYLPEMQSPWLHLRLDWVSTNSYRGWISTDGFTWNDFGAGNFTATVTPTHYGPVVSTWNGTAAGAQMATFDFFRVYTVKPTHWVET